MRTHTCTPICMHARKCTLVHADTHKHVPRPPTHTFVCMHTHTHERVHVNAHTPASTHAYTHACTHILLMVHMAQIWLRKYSLFLLSAYHLKQGECVCVLSLSLSVFLPAKHYNRQCACVPNCKLDYYYYIMGKTLAKRA